MFFCLIVLVKILCFDIFHVQIFKRQSLLGDIKVLWKCSKMLAVAGNFSFLRLTGKELIIKMRMNMPYLISRSCRWGIWRSTARHKTVRCDYELNSFQQLQGIVHPKNNQWLVTFLLFQTSFDSCSRVH